MEHLESIGDGVFQIIFYSNKKSVCRTRALEISQFCKANGITFIVCGDLEIAVQSNADGLHLKALNYEIDVIRKRLGQYKIIGLEVANYRQAEAVKDNGFDYICPGPVFRDSMSIDNGMPVGCELVRAINKSIQLPQYAYGGINSLNANLVFSAGAYGVIIDYDPSIFPLLKSYG